MPNVIFSIIAFILAFLLGLIVLIKNQKSFVNKMFFLFSVVIGLMFFSDMLIMLSSTSSSALSFTKVYTLFLVLFPAVFLHFTTVFPKQRTSLEEYVKLLFYVPTIFFMIVSSSVLSGVYFTTFFNPYIDGTFFILYFLVYAVFGIRNFYVSFNEPDTEIKKMQSAYAVIGITIFVLFFGLSEIILPMFSIFPYRVGNLFCIVMFSFILYSVNRHYLFVREPLAEQCSASILQKYPIFPGSSVIVKDKGFHESFNVFLDQVLHGRSGLVITRTNPSKIMEEYPLKRTPIIWLTELNEKDSINPNDIEEIGYAVERFIGTANNGVVYLDGVEYLSTFNTFLKTLHLVQDLRDKVSEVSSSFIVPIKSDAFSEVQLKLIERDFEIL